MKNSSDVYLEVYGINHVVYRVTASVIKQNGKNHFIYGVSLEDIRKGESSSIDNFSDNIENTLSFANELVHKKIRPYMLYSEALRHLRFSPSSVLS